MKRLIFLAAFVLAACNESPPPSQPTPPPVPSATPSSGPTIPAASPITHIVVIEQENRTVDNLFHGYPDGNTFPGPADTSRTGLNSKGQQVALVPQSLAATCGPSHSHNAFVTEYDNGKLDGFDLSQCKEPGGTVYGFAPSSEVAAYWAIAEAYGMANHVLQLNQGPSFPAHQQLIAGQAGGIGADGTIAPHARGFSENGGTHDKGVGSGGHTSCGVPLTDTVTQIDLTSQFPGVEDSSAYPCYDVTTVFDLLAAKRLSWRYYGNKTGGLWAGPQSIKHLWNSPNYVVGGPRFFTDLAAGTLANVTYIIPAARWSDHPGRRNRIASDGPNWVGDIVDAVGQSSFWNTTAVVVTWDDWGGFYDSYRPVFGRATGTYGFRVPVLVASAWSIPGAVDSAQTSQAAILRLIETTFGLPSLNAADAWTSDDLGSLFDFTKGPNKFVNIQTTEPPSYFQCKHCLLDDEDVDG